MTDRVKKLGKKIKFFKKKKLEDEETFDLITQERDSLVKQLTTNMKYYEADE